MNRHLLILLRVQLRMAWRSFLEKSSNRSSRVGLILLPLILLAFIPFVGGMGSLAYGLYIGGEPLGQGQVALTFFLAAGQIACLTFGIFYVVSAFYYSKDLSILVPLPIRPGEIVLAKFLSIMVGEYATMAPVVLPALAVYGWVAKVGPQYIPFALVIYLLLPVVPLVISALFSLVLMKVTNLRSNRDMWRVFGAIVGVSLALGTNYVTRMAGTRRLSGQTAQQLLAANPNLVQAVGKYFPTSLWATDALREGAPAYGIVPFLLFSLVALAALALMVWAAEQLFLGGLVGGDEVKRTGKALSSGDLARETGTVRAPLRALLQREIRLLNRTPSFLMAAVMPVIIFPLMFGMSALQGQEIPGLLFGLRRFSDSPLVPVIGIGAVLFLTATSNIAPTSVSREGKHFWISRSVPIAPHTQVHAKALHNLLFGALYVALVAGALGFFGLVRALGLTYVILGGLAVTMVSGYAGILVDLIRPHLKWSDPQQAMKGNLNGLFNLVLTLVLGVLGAGVTFVGYKFSPPLAPPALILVNSLVAFVLGRIAGAVADQRYVQIED